jgi:hypothetical protein
LWFWRAIRGRCGLDNPAGDPPVQFDTHMTPAVIPFELIPIHRSPWLTALKFVEQVTDHCTKEGTFPRKMMSSQWDSGYISEDTCQALLGVSGASCRPMPQGETSDLPLCREIFNDGQVVQLRTVHPGRRRSQAGYTGVACAAGSCGGCRGSRQSDRDHAGAFPVRARYSPARDP